MLLLNPQAICLLKTNGSLHPQPFAAKSIFLKLWGPGSGEASVTINIKSVIDRDGATCRNNNHFDRPTILNAPWDEHSMMFLTSISNKQAVWQTNGRTDGRMYQTYYLPCFAVDNKEWWELPSTSTDYLSHSIHHVHTRSLAMRQLSPIFLV